MPSSELILNAVLYGVLLPALVTALGLLAGLRLKRSLAPVAVALGIGAGLVALAWTGQINWGFVKPERSWDWLPGFALLALLACGLDLALSRPTVERWIRRVILAALAGWALVVAERAVQPREIESMALWWTAALALAVVILWGLLDYSARKYPSPVQPGILALLLFAGAAVMEMTGNAALAQTAGVIGAALLAVCAVASWRSPYDLVCAPIPAVAVFLPGLLFALQFNNYSPDPPIPSSSFVLLAVAPLPLGTIGLTRNKSRTLMLLSATASLLLIGLAIALAARAYLNE